MVVACQDIYVQIYMCDMRASVYDVHVECAFLSKTYDHCYCTNQYRIPQQKKRKKTHCVLPQCMRIPNIYSLYVVTKSCCSHLYNNKKYRNIVFHSLHAKIKLWYWTWNKIRKTHMNNGIGWSYQQFVHAGFHMAYADACDACGSSTIHKMLHTYNVGEGSMIQMNVLFHPDMNCV